MQVKLNRRFASSFAVTTNAPQFANPGTTLGSSNFGYVTSTIGGNSTASNGNRVLQIDAKFSFLNIAKFSINICAN